jgi:outer membrane biosynthesis protein TonB
MPAPKPARLASSALFCSGALLPLTFALLAAGCAPARTPEAPSAAAADAEPLLSAGAEEPAAAPEEPATTEPAAPSAESGSTTPASGPRDTRTKEVISRVITDNRQKVRDCYDAALATNPGIAGDLVVGFVISPDGGVKQAEVNWAESDIHVPELDTCAAEAVRSFKFPASSRGLESKVNFPFNFKAQPSKGDAPASTAKPSTR